MRAKSYIAVVCAAMGSLMSVGLVHGQAVQPPAQSGPAAPKIDDLYEQNLKATERLSEYMNELQKQITNNNQRLNQELKNFTDAEKDINDLLESLKKGIEMGDPNGEFVKLIERFIDESQSAANKAKSRQADGLYEEFVKRKDDFRASKDAMLRLYPQYMTMYRAIENRKGDLELAKQLRSLNEASKIVGAAVKQYERAGPMFKEVMEKFPRPDNSLTQ
jgi:hypothetical protein